MNIHDLTALSQCYSVKKAILESERQVYWRRTNMSELYLNIKRNSHVFSSFRDLYHVFINMGAFLMKEKLLDNDIFFWRCPELFAWSENVILIIFFFSSVILLKEHSLSLHSCEDHLALYKTHPLRLAACFHVDNSYLAARHVAGIIDQWIWTFFDITTKILLTYLDTFYSNQMGEFDHRSSTSPSGTRL